MALDSVAAQPTVDAEPEPTAAELATQASTVTKPPGGAEWLTSFTLTERSGEQVSDDDLEGRPYVVSFFFSTCPSICVMQNQKIQQLQTEFDQVECLYVADGHHRSAAADHVPDVGRARE